MKQLAADRLSTSQIARVLNVEFHIGLSRNAIVGKCHRDNIPLLCKAPGDGWKPPAPRKDKPKAIPRHVPLPAAIPLAQEPAAPPLFVVDNPAEIPGLDNCHWPIGDVGHENFRYCWHPVEPALAGRLRPYCPFHWKLRNKPFNARQIQLAKGGLARLT